MSSLFSHTHLVKDTRTLLVISNFVNVKRVRIPDMITQLETTFNITVDNDKSVSNQSNRRTYPSPTLFLSSTLANRCLSYTILIYLTPQTLMSVVDQLDQMLFEKFITPKVTVATGKLRGGILDPKMDWYETPQPTGERCLSAPRCDAPFLVFPSSDHGVNMIYGRDPTLHV